MALLVWENLLKYLFPGILFNHIFHFNIAPQYVAHFYGIVFTLFAVFYSVLGGMHSIVLGDLIKYIVMTVGCISIGIIAMMHLHGSINTSCAAWMAQSIFWMAFEFELVELSFRHANKKIKDDGFELFGLFFMMMLFKGVFASLAGPAPNYDMQKILSSRSPKEASKMTGFVSIILLPIRYSMVIGLTVLGLLYFNS